MKTNVQLLWIMLLLLLMMMMMMMMMIDDDDNNDDDDNSTQQCTSSTDSKIPGYSITLIQRFYFSIQKQIEMNTSIH